MEDNYFHCSDVLEGTCVTDLRIFYPDFLATKSSDLSVMKTRVEAMDMIEVGRFVNGIKALQLGDDVMTIGEFSDGLTKISVWDGYLNLSVEEVVLFQNRRIKPRY